MKPELMERLFDLFARYFRTAQIVMGTTAGCMQWQGEDVVAKGRIESLLAAIEADSVAALTAELESVKSECPGCIERAEAAHKTELAALEARVRELEGRNIVDSPYRKCPGFLYVPSTGRLYGLDRCSKSGEFDICSTCARAN